MVSTHLRLLRYAMGHYMRFLPSDPFYKGHITSAYVLIFISYYIVVYADECWRPKRHWSEGAWLSAATCKLVSFKFSCGLGQCFMPDLHPSNYWVFWNIYVLSGHKKRVYIGMKLLNIWSSRWTKSCKFLFPYSTNPISEQKPNCSEKQMHIDVDNVLFISCLS